MSDTEEPEVATNPAPSGWNAEEFKALGIAGGALVLWILAIAIFGFAGLIVPALRQVTEKLHVASMSRYDRFSSKPLQAYRLLLSSGGWAGS